MEPRLRRLPLERQGVVAEGLAPGLRAVAMDEPLPDDVSASMAPGNDGAQDDVDAALLAEPRARGSWLKTVLVIVVGVLLVAAGGKYAADRFAVISQPPPDRSLNEVDADVIQLKKQLLTVQSATAEQPQLNSELQRDVKALTEVNAQIRDSLSQLGQGLKQVGERVSAQGVQLDQQGQQLVTLKQGLNTLEQARKAAEERRRQAALAAPTPVATVASAKAPVEAVGPKPPFELVTIESYDLRDYAVVRAPGRGLVSAATHDYVVAWRVIEIDAERHRVLFENLAGARRWLTVE